MGNVFAVGNEHCCCGNSARYRTRGVSDREGAHAQHLSSLAGLPLLRQSPSDSFVVAFECFAYQPTSGTFWGLGRLFQTTANVYSTHVVDRKRSSTCSRSDCSLHCVLRNSTRQDTLTSIYSLPPAIANTGRMTTKPASKAGWEA